MSGPAVVIGFILLVPSILGIILSAFIFLGVNAHTGSEPGFNASEPSSLFQSPFDANFRRNCAETTRQQSQNASQQLIEQYCECALSTFKETSSLALTRQTCLKRAKDGTLEQPSSDVDAFYSSNTSTENRTDAGASLVRFFGSVSAVALGIASFVGGLLGWLLVMRKRVLQCDTCGAIVNAS
jgi:hypothetical protein